MTRLAYHGAIAAAQQLAGPSGGGAHRYWRVLVTAIEGGASVVGLAELEFWDRRHARRAAGTYSESGATLGAGRAYDGIRQTGSNAASYWLSNTGTIWIAIDAGEGQEFELAAVVIWKGGFSAGTYGHVNGFDIQYSDNGTTWTTLWAEAGDPLVSGPDEPGLFENPFYSGDPEPVLDPGLTPLHWLDLAAGAYSDEGSTPAIDNDGIRLLTNHGSDGNDYEQASPGLCPTFKTGGLNGKPFLRCAHANAQRFDDIAITQPSGTTTVSPYIVAAVTDNLDLANSPALLGSTVTSGGKIGVHFRPDADAQIHIYKNNFRFGNVANPQVLVMHVQSFSVMRGWLNGAAQNLSVSGTPASTAITAANLLWNDGLASDGYFDGDLYELLYIPGTYTDMQLFRVSEYLNGKYGGIY